MLLSKPRTLLSSRALARIAAIGAFAALSAVSARVTVNLPFTPVPATLQVLVVLLAGLVLGPRDGALSQLAYLAAITAGLPLDARALGPAVWASPTAGYLAGFVCGAFAAGWVAERARGRLPGAEFLAGAAGILALYSVGAAWLTVFFLHGDAAAGWAAGVAPFLLVDLLKAAAAALLSGSGRRALRALAGSLP
ncbi:MAG: biotin transporter BioY [Anaerolineales bacterium]|nr:biotin transporter BioY [Anaerolineales bacterium]